MHPHTHRKVVLYPRFPPLLLRVTSGPKVSSPITAMKCSQGSFQSVIAPPFSHFSSSWNLVRPCCRLGCAPNIHNIALQPPSRESDGQWTIFTFLLRYNRWRLPHLSERTRSPHGSGYRLLRWARGGGKWSRDRTVSDAGRAMTWESPRRVC